MSSSFRIFAVDDVESARRLLHGAFSKDYDFEAFESAEACLQRVVDSPPDLFLLDIDLPGMDGYALCRELKSMPAVADKPVIFLSGLDDLESRLQGYDAGGIDFFVKPYKVAELRQKIELARTSSEAKNVMQQQMTDSETLTSLVMANLDEYALLIKFLRALNTCQGRHELADVLFGMLRGFKLDCAVQFRLDNQPDLTVSAQGENLPMETAIMQHVRTLGTIFEFKTRAAFNFPHITVLVNNMPVEDPEFCGRIRDYLAIAVESADAKLDAIHIRIARNEDRSHIDAVLDDIGNTVTSFATKYDRARTESTLLTDRLLTELTGAFAHLGLTDEQEHAIENIVRSRAFELADLYDFGEAMQEALHRVQERLRPIISG